MQLPSWGAMAAVTVAEPQKRFEAVQTSLIFYSTDLVHVSLNPSVFIHKREGLV